jgi:Putative adhesin
VKTAWPLLLLLLASACAAQTPTLKRSGPFQPGGTIAVRNIRGDINVFAPERGQSPNEYTVWAYEPPDVAKTTVTVQPLLVTAQAHAADVRFLVRGPSGAAIDVSTTEGNINVADVDGIVNARTGRGDIKMLIPLYGNASIGSGNMSVVYASTTWPGTLHFTTDNGNIELYVNENARAAVHLHTDNGSIFSDFGLRGTSEGTSETIDSVINGGGPRSINVDVHIGSIRLMQLKPQV